MSQIIDAVRSTAPDLDIRLAFVELVEPDVATALRAIPPDRGVILVPLLLSSGYHDQVDIPAAVAAARPDTVRTAVLGPDPLLATALADRLAEAGGGADAVVLAAAGSGDPAAVASVVTQTELLAAELATRRGRPVPVTAAYGSAAAPDVRTAVAAARSAGAGRVAVATYLLAPGFFADRLGAAGADLVAAPLGAHPAVVELVLRRFAAARH